MPEGRKVYWTRSQSFAFAGGLLVFGALLLDAVLGAKHHSTGGYIFLGVVVLLMSVTFVRGALAVLIVTDRGVKVRNPCRTVVIGWEEIEAFALGRYKILGCVCLIRCRSGRVLPAFGIQGITGQPHRMTSVFARQAVDELNQRLARVNAGGAAIKPPGAAGP